MRPIIALGIFLAATTLPAQQQPGPQPAAPAAQQPVPTAQQPAPNAPPAVSQPLTTEAKVVTLYATVRDKHNSLISNLSQSDFTVSEDNRPQKITYFRRETDLPLTVGVMVDTSLSQRHVIGSERTASSAFFDHVLRPDKDKAFLMHFDYDAELLEDITDSREKLKAALADLQTPDFDQMRSSRDGGPRRRGGTVLYDSIYLASNELMKKQQGRKAVVLLTDGVDRGSKVTITEAIESALRADTAVYAIYYADPDESRSSYAGNRGGYGGRGGSRGGGRYPSQEQRPDGKKILERIARETGGRFYQVSKKESVDEIYTQLEDELRKQYALAYTPDRPHPGAGFHMLAVTAGNKDLTVQSRDGYYSDK